MRRTSFFSALLGVAFVVTSCTALYYPGDDYFDAADAAAPIAESGPPTDGPVEAAVDASLVCPANAFCDDFERDGVPNGLWTQSGAVAIDGTHSHSPTRALTATSKKGVDASYVYQGGNGITPKSRFELWFFTPTAAPRGGGYHFRLAQFFWGDDCDWDLTWELQINADEGLTLGLGAYDKSINSSCGPIDYHLSPALLTPATLFTNGWHHVVIENDVSTATRKARVSVDGQPSVDVQATSQRKTVPTVASVGIGIPCVRLDAGCIDYSGPDYQVWVDDFIVVAE